MCIFVKKIAQCFLICNNCADPVVFIGLDMPNVQCLEPSFLTFVDPAIFSCVDSAIFLWVQPF